MNRRKSRKLEFDDKALITPIQEGNAVGKKDNLAANFIAQIFSSRIFILIIIFILMSFVLIGRVFYLQIVNGEKAQSEYILKVIKEKSLKSTRGNIYDRNGNLLAYNELAYEVTIEDNGTYSTTAEKNEKINGSIAKVLHCIDANGDEIDNSFGIVLEDGEFVYDISGTKQKRFLADIYGKTSVDDLGYDEKLGYSTAYATADQVMNYLFEKRFGVSEDYSKKDRYRIAVIRYNMSQNSYQKYINTTIASNVGESTVAYVSEHAYELQGVKIAENTIRKYNNSKYFAHIIGYTGLIDEDEYTAFSEISDEYSRTDTVGKSGIEQYMDTELKGKKGYEKLFVDNMGKELESIEKEESVAGNDVYLSIDMDLQMAVYEMLEQEIAGILYSKIINEKEYTATGSSDVKIPIDDVYFALINNNIISIADMADENASPTEEGVYSRFLQKRDVVYDALKKELTASNPKAYKNLSGDMQVYISYVLTMLTDNGIVEPSKFDWNDEVYQDWKNDKISLKEYLNYMISVQWIDITAFAAENEYADTDEIYSYLLDYVFEKLETDRGFAKKIFKFMLRDNNISGRDICMLLFEQGVLDYDDERISKLKSGTISAFDFIMDCIRNLEITPAMLALDPCTGSCVLTNVKTGELLACVTYPGYDNNRLANKVDSAYFSSLLNDLSLPLYNNATQQKTAPGSTFKMVTATAGLTEGVISVSEKIEDEGVFNRVTNGPKCWKWPYGNHGSINVSEALRDSCNYYFYEVGWRLSCANNEDYDEEQGIGVIDKYASLYGLGETTGIEISESTPEIATQYPITASIGQSNNNYTTVALSRYVTAVANSGKVYNYTLLSKLTDSKGEIIREYAPTVKNEMKEISKGTWTAIHYGNLMVCENMNSFDDFTEIKVAGKTGTAQQIDTRPNHALFVGYAPYSNPEISIATRIAYGYTSHNAADVSANILKYYFKLEDENTLVNGQAANVGNTSNSFND